MTALIALTRNEFRLLGREPLYLSGAWSSP